MDRSAPELVGATQVVQVTGTAAPCPVALLGERARHQAAHLDRDAGQGVDQRPGVVVIQFRVNADNELCQLTVFSQNEEINNNLTKQLIGKKLIGYGSDAAELHTVRLRFQPE